MTIDPAKGIGDDADYEVFGSRGAELVVRKGGNAFQVRILNGTGFRPFTLAQERTKEADLARDAAARL